MQAICTASPLGIAYSGKDRRRLDAISDEKIATKQTLSIKLNIN
jgi:hypothetical protein